MDALVSAQKLIASQKEFIANLERKAELLEQICENKDKQIASLEKIRDSNEKHIAALEKLARL